MSINRQGNVFVNGVLAGALCEYKNDQQYSYSFTYHVDQLDGGIPIGHHFPVVKAPYTFDSLPPFFTNLSSEGWLRAHQSKKAKLDQADSFGLLLANGKELIGAISVIPVDIKSKGQ